MYPTSHEHHLSLHKNSQLNDVKPQHKVLGCFLIVLSVAFSNVQNIFQIVSHIVIVMYILYLSKIPLKTYLKRLTLDIPFILFALFCASFISYTAISYSFLSKKLTHK